LLAPIVLVALQGVLLGVFVSVIPLHRMYSTADSGEYQRMALFILGQASLAGGYSQNFVPGLPAVVAGLSLVLGNIDIASLIANFVFSSSALLVFLRLSGSLKLSIALVFIPYWLIASFSTLADISFIAFELAAIYLMTRRRTVPALIAGVLSAAFRLEGIFLVIVLLAAIIHSKQFKKEFLICPALCFIPAVAWGTIAFDNPLITFAVKAPHVLNVGYVVAPILSDLSLGLVGAGKIGYVALTLVASAMTIWVAYKKVGFYNVLTLVAVTMTVLHTVLSPIHVFPDMSRLYLYIAPISLMVFPRPLEKWFFPVLLLLAPVAMFVAYIFWTVTFSTPFP
jgi:hypothetical protein